MSFKEWRWEWKSFTLLVVLFLLVQLLKACGFGLIYQTSSSMPRGWYLAIPLIGKIHKGEAVLFTPPLQAETFMRVHHWILPHAWMMKHILAEPGDAVCIKQNSIWINHKKVGPVFQATPSGVKLPQAQLCGVLASEHYLPLSTLIPNSFDGRYFGAISRNQIISKVIPL